MPCKLDKDCVFSDQKPECERVQICCNEKLAVKDAEINRLRSKLIGLARKHRDFDIMSEELLKELAEMKDNLNA